MEFGQINSCLGILSVLIRLHQPQSYVFLAFVLNFEAYNHSCAICQLPLHSGQVSLKPVKP